MPPAYHLRINRARILAREDPHAATLLTQYASILEAQEACYDMLAGRPNRLTGSLNRDLPELRPCAERALATLRPSLPPEVTASAPHSDGALDALLENGWRMQSAPFLARLVLQPYTEALVQHGHRPEGRDFQTPPGSAACPFCGGLPQVSVHRSDTSADGGSRMLLCALCSTEWPLRRVLCVHCGEQDERRLNYFRIAESPAFDHIRIDACDACRRYVKTVDLTRSGIAVPFVDEVASAVLDIWAHDHGYTKVERNLLGL